MSGGCGDDLPAGDVGPGPRLSPRLMGFWYAFLWAVTFYVIGACSHGWYTWMPYVVWAIGCIVSIVMIIKGFREAHKATE